MLSDFQAAMPKKTANNALLVCIRAVFLGSRDPGSFAE
jgi:hypothetical protein